MFLFTQEWTKFFKPIGSWNMHLKCNWDSNKICF